MGQIGWTPHLDDADDAATDEEKGEGGDGADEDDGEPEDEAGNLRSHLRRERLPRNRE